VRDLDAVDQYRFATMSIKVLKPVTEAVRTREALRRFGADPDVVSADEAAARVSSSVVRERIVSALERLLLPIRLVDVDSLPETKRKSYTELRADMAALLPKTVGVRAVLRRVDADPYRDAVRDTILAGDRAKFAELLGRKEALEQPPWFIACLGGSGAIEATRRRQVVGAAVSRRPGDVALLMTLAHDAEELDEQVRWYQAAVAAAPTNVIAHNNPGNALGHRGKKEEAIACYRQAIEIDPKNFLVHINLGGALMGSKGREEEAIACLRNGVAFGPEFALAHSGLGTALLGKGQTDEAVACFRKAIELDPNLDPKHAPVHNHLGNVLMKSGRTDEAIACYRKTLELDPKNVTAHTNLGSALAVKGKAEEAIACFEKAIAIDPMRASADANLGRVYSLKNRWDEAGAGYRKFIDLNPRDASAHTSLGLALGEKGRVDEAIACRRKASALDPKIGRAHVALASALAGKGRYGEARDASARAFELLPAWDPLRKVVSQQMRTCERLAKPEARLPRLLGGGEARLRSGDARGRDVVPKEAVERISRALRRRRTGHRPEVRPPLRRRLLRRPRRRRAGRGRREADGRRAAGAAPAGVDLVARRVGPVGAAVR
jgi:tetratricopeptide (TPR) repeat protein